MRRRRTGAALAAVAVMLALSTWWAAGTAAAASPMTSRLVLALPATGALPSWPPQTPRGEALMTAAVGSALIALAASVRRVS